MRSDGKRFVHPLAAAVALATMALAGSMALPSPARSAEAQPDVKVHEAKPALPKGFKRTLKMPADPAALQPEGDAALSIVFDAVSGARSISVEPRKEFEFHLVARSPQGGVNAWEAWVEIDPRITILDRKSEGHNLGKKPDQWRVGLGLECKAGPEMVLVTYRAMVLEPANDLVLKVLPVEGGSFDPPSPGYLTCLAEGDLRSFAAPEVAAVVNPEKIQLPSGRNDAVQDLLKPARSRH